MANAPQPIKISGNLIMLTEGESDNRFFSKLIVSRGLPKFTFPFPPLRSKDEPESGPPLYSKDGFVNMLNALYATFKITDENEAMPHLAQRAATLQGCSPSASGLCPVGPL